MVKSLGDYNIEKSSSTDTKNIQWSRKNPTDIEKSKIDEAGKMFQKSSVTNSNIQQGWKRKAR